MVDAVVFYSKVLLVLSMSIAGIMIIYLLITGWDDEG